MSNCNCHQENIRDGSGSLSRYLHALDPSYAPIDNRSLQELLVFIQKYAAKIRFYDIPESKIDDGIPPEKVSWENFFKKDMAVIAASIGTTDIEEIKKEYDAVRDDMEATPEADLLSKLLMASVNLANKINDWYALAIPANPLYNDLDAAIHSFLSGQLQRIMAYEEGYKLINAQKPLGLEYGVLDENELWGTDKPIMADASIYEGDTVEEKILNAALYADEIFNGFLAAVTDRVNGSEDYLQYALEKYPGHQPHMALFIAFLQLFQLAQQQMNALTGRLLDYYYKDVLKLTAKAALPDKVHIVFELAKNVAAYDLAKHTSLKAGKDNAGIDQIYATDDELVINQAKIKEIKTVFIDKTVELENQQILNSIYANPVASSADGNGKPFTNETDIKWPTFGGVQKPQEESSGICEALRRMNEADTVLNAAMPGFAVASPQLVLGGGNRLIVIASDGVDKLITQLVKSGSSNPLTIWLTGEKEWVSITKIVTEDELNKMWDGEVFVSSTAINEPVYGYTKAGSEEFRLVVFLPVSTEAIIAFDPSLHPGYTYPLSLPVMQVMLNPGFNIPETLFSQIKISNFSINIKVGSISSGKLGVQMDGLKSLILQNDDQLLQPGKAMNPFTFMPAQGKSFYIGSEEFGNKPLNQLAINIRTTSENVNWTLQVYALKNKQWFIIKSNSGKDVFSIMDLSHNILEADKSILLDRKPIVKLSDWNPDVLKGFIRLDNQTIFSQGEFPSQLTFQEMVAMFEIKEVSVSYTSLLESMEEGIDHFYHVYPFGVAEIALDSKYDNDFVINDAVGSKEGPEKKRVLSSRKNLSPYAVREFHPGTSALGDSNAINGANKLLPQFTYTGVYDEKSRDNSEKEKLNATHNGARSSNLFNALRRLIPGKNNINQYSGSIQEEGILFIGLENSQPLQTVSMLFQFAEGSAEDEDNDPPPIHWSYLSHNQWHPLPGENLITDGTYGFQTTGIIKVSMPADVTNNDTIITSGLYWLRASVTENANRIPMLISIVTQAVMAVFDNNNNSPDHYNQALPAESISKLKTPVSQIGKVLQPFASFDAKPAESGREFYARVSERLRHKQRAITAWDYEHLVLDHFPSVYKVKCITHTDPNCLCRKRVDENGNPSICCGPQVAPGHVLLIPIANLKNRNGVDPLQPKMARRVLIEMVEYIKNLTSPFVKVYAKNPVYEQIIVFFRVQFITGTDIGFYLKKLNDEIVEYLTPWAFNEEADVVFGQKVYASSIINFIEERSYIDFITDFEMGVCKDGCCPPTRITNNGNNDSPADTISSFNNCNDIEIFLSINTEDTGEIVARPSTARSILVSAPRHIIIPYKAPPVISPCDQRQLQKLNTVKVNENEVNHLVKKPEIKKSNEVSSPKNNISEVKVKGTASIPSKKIAITESVIKERVNKRKVAPKKGGTSAGTNTVKDKKSDNIK